LHVARWRVGCASMRISCSVPPLTVHHSLNLHASHDLLIHLVSQCSGQMLHNARLNSECRNITTVTRRVYAMVFPPSQGAKENDSLAWVSVASSRGVHKNVPVVVVPRFQSYGNIRTTRGKDHEQGHDDGGQHWNPYACLRERKRQENTQIQSPAMKGEW
jgi:hypothetical protein